MHRFGAGGRKAVIAVGMVPESNRGQLNQCAGGQFDSNIRRIGTAMINAGEPDTVLRLGWEANRVGGFPWAVQGDGSSWKACYRHWVSVLRSLPGQNFVMVWNMGQKGTFPLHIDNMYPGSDVVDVIGTQFYVMEHVEGRIFFDVRLQDVSREDRVVMYEQLADVLAKIHAVDVDAVGLSDYGKAGQYVERQVARWTQQYRAAETETIPAMEALIDWLPQHLPPEGPVGIVHGDYRLDNVMFHPTEPRILAVLDWELSTLGHPLVDFAYHCMTWHMTNGPTSRGLAGADLAALGISGQTLHAVS